MGDYLFELEQVLRSGKQENITPQEVNVLATCKQKALTMFMAGGLAGGGLTWAATWKLNRLYRMNLAVGAAAVFGLTGFTRAVDSSIDTILAQDGSRIQRELASIIVHKPRADPKRMQLISKYFYPEKLYDDANPEPRLKWRYRAYFTDNIGFNANEDGYDGQSHSNFYNSHSQNSSDSSNAPSNISASDKSKKVSVKSPGTGTNTSNSTGTDTMGDPLQYMFGDMSTVEEIHHPSASSTGSKINHPHKRSRRRRRMRHQETEDKSEV